eukprot:SAG31_NODE_19553_length_599_cov_0.596000_1_plen_28_part_10
MKANLCAKYNPAQVQNVLIQREQKAVHH